jgi:predicted HNH restriction endonuclease
MTSTSISESHRLGAGKSWFKMTSRGGKKVVKGIRPLYANLFMFQDYNRARVILRPGITQRKALAAIGKGHLRRLYVAKVTDLKKKNTLLRKMVLREGAVLKTLRSVYVRDPNARQQCINKYGPKCFICKFSFKESYGKVADGFIHVHHVRQLSNIRKEHRVDPVKHLRPVCPNCHAVLHLSNPAYSIEKVQSFLRR